MKLFHTSPSKIEKITSFGMFGECLFFSSEPYYMTMAKNPLLYSIDIDEDSIISVSALEDMEIQQRICEVLGVDMNSAERMLDGRDTAFEHGGDVEDDYWIQGLQGECAKKMGYLAARAMDEQGVVYIVPMLGKESELHLERIGF